MVWKAIQPRPMKLPSHRGSVILVGNWRIKLTALPLAEQDRKRLKMLRWRQQNR